MKTWIEYKIEDKEYCIKEPNRREKDEADIYYASKIGSFIKQGALTKAMLLKEYENNGGALTKEESKKMQVLRRSLLDDQNTLTKIELKKRQTKTDKAKSETVRNKIADTMSDLQQFEAYHEALFSHTADVLARNHLIMWWLIKCTYHKNKKEKEWEALFDKETLDENLDLYDEITEDSLIEKALHRGMSLLALWLSSNVNSKEDFQEILRLLEDQDEKPAETT